MIPHSHRMRWNRYPPNHPLADETASPDIFLPLESVEDQISDDDLVVSPWRRTDRLARPWLSRLMINWPFIINPPDR